MKHALLAAILAAMTLTACGKPNQALPEQEKDNFAKITSSPGTPAESAAPSAEDDANKE